MKIPILNAIYDLVYKGGCKFYQKGGELAQRRISVVGDDERILFHQIRNLAHLGSVHRTGPDIR
ncbi:hypothetical protein ABIC16_004015 [Sphingomonas sp. PvP055]